MMQPRTERTDWRSSELTPIGPLWQELVAAQKAHSLISSEPPHENAIGLAERRVADAETAFDACLRRMTGISLEMMRKVTQ